MTNLRESSATMEAVLAKLQGRKLPPPEPVVFTAAEREAAKKVLTRLTAAYSTFEVGRIERVVNICEDR